MPNHITIQDALDYCLANPDGLSTSQLLARFPEQAEQLQSLLQLAQNVEKIGPPSVPTERREAMKQRLVQAAAARQATQANPAVRVPTAPATQGWRKGWSFSLPRLAWGAALLAVLMIAFIWRGSSGSLPNSPLYNVKLAAERVSVSLASSPADRVRAHTAIANTRLGEVQTLEARHELALMERPIDDYHNHINQGAVALSETTDGTRTELAKILYKSSVDGSDIFLRLEKYNNVTANISTRLDRAIQAASAISGVTGEYLSEAGVPPETIAPRKEAVPTTLAVAPPAARATVGALVGAGKTPSATVAGGAGSVTPAQLPSQTQSAGSPVLPQPAPVQGGTVLAGLGTPTRPGGSKSTPSAVIVARAGSPTPTRGGVVTVPSATSNGIVSAPSRTATRVLPAATATLVAPAATNTALAATQTAVVLPPTRTPQIVPTNAVAGTAVVPPTRTRTPGPPVPVPPTHTRTPGPPVRSATPTSVPPTNTVPAPTNTSIVVPPSSTAVPATNTAVPPTNTAIPPTSTEVPPTNTAVPPTNTAIPPTRTSTSVPPTTTPRPVPTANVCDLDIQDVSEVCTSTTCVAWVALVSNRGSLVTRASWTAELQIKQGSGGFHTVATLHGTSDFIIGVTPVTGNLCYNFPADTDHVKVRFSIDNNGGECTVEGTTGSEDPCGVSPVVTPTPRGTNTPRPTNTPHPTNTTAPTRTPIVRPTEELAPR